MAKQSTRLLSELLNLIKKDKDTKQSPETDLYQFWGQPLLECLLSDDESLFNGIITHILPLILRLFPSSFKTLIFDLSINSLNQHHNKSNVRLKALLASLKKARAEGNIQNGSDLYVLLKESINIK